MAISKHSFQANEMNEILLRNTRRLASLSLWLDDSVSQRCPGSLCFSSVNMNQATQQMQGAADVAVTESAVLSYTPRINTSSKPS